jgi:hypothetical protein
MTDAERRRLAAKSEELLKEADRLDEYERQIDALPEGSDELVDAAEHAEGHATRLHDVANEERALTREVLERRRT